MHLIEVVGFEAIVFHNFVGAYKNCLHHMEIDVAILNNVHSNVKLKTESRILQFCVPTITNWNEWNYQSL